MNPHHTDPVRRYRDEATPEQIRDELNRAERITFVPRGCDQQGRLTPSIAPAEPCSDLCHDHEAALTAAGRFWIPYIALAAGAVAGFVFITWR